MSKIKIAINGVGRIGRTLLRTYVNQLKDNPDLGYEVVALNNPGDRTSHVHLLRYDSVHGRFPETVSIEGNELQMGKAALKFYNYKNPADIPWSDLGVQIVIDSTGIFKDKKSLSAHLGGSVKKAIMCAPGKDLDGTFVFGINHNDYDSENHNVISNASCTTNCLAPVAKVINDSFGIVNGFMTTVHAYTNDQNILDNSHSDLRRARAGALNIIPTSTGAAKAVGLVLPELMGKLDGFAVRVPTPNVSMVDLTVNLEKTPTIESVNEAIKAAANGQMKGILAYTYDECVSTDFLGRQESSIFDMPMTNVSGNTLKIVTWYDNEVGFSNRVLDLVNHVGSKL
jgi:glyceraldehyde 3-phosphate dehydrogenase